MRVVEVQGAENVRDLGGIPVFGGRVVKPRLLYRGSALGALAAEGVDVLFRQRGVTCVVDLRCGWERTAKPDVEVPGVENLHIPFYDQEKVGIEYTEPAEGTKVVGRDVACDPDRFYRSLANPLTVGQMRQCLDEIFSRVAEGKPVYVHCSGGKDRAGIMTLLVLTVLGASPEAIRDDYLLTNESRDKNYQENYERFLNFAEGNEQRARELVDSHRARPENLQAFYEVVCQRYGCMEDFLEEKLGMSAARCAWLREKCTAEMDVAGERGGSACAAGGELVADGACVADGGAGIYADEIGMYGDADVRGSEGNGGDEGNETVSDMRKDAAL